MVNTGSEDAWQIRAAISIDDGTTHLVFQAITEEIEADLSERELDKIDLLDDNQIPKHGGLSVATISFKGYPLYAGSTIKGIATGFWDVFAQAPAADTTDPIGQGATWVGEIMNIRTKYRVAILMTNESEETGIVTGIANTVLTASAESWTNDDYIARMVVPTAGTKKGTAYVITDNDSTTLTCAGATMDDDDVNIADTFKIIHTGSGSIQAASKAKRLVIAEATCVSCKVNPYNPNEPWSVTMTFKCPALDKAGAGNIRKQSHDGSGSTDLAELATYVPGTTKW